MGLDEWKERERGGNEKAEEMNGETGSCKIERRGTLAQRGRGYGNTPAGEIGSRKKEEI